MSVFGPAHPLDVDLADLVEGMLDDASAAAAEAHVAHCTECRLKRDRLRSAPPGALHLDRTLPSPRFVVSDASGGEDTGRPDAERPEPAIADLWLTGSGQRLLVTVLRVDGDRVVVAPVTFGVEAADETTLIVDAADSPLPSGLAVHPELATEVPRAVLIERVASFASVNQVSGGGRRGPAVVDTTDPRLEIRERLADLVASVAEQAPDPGDTSPAGAGHVGSSLIDDIRDLRGPACAVRTLPDWDDVVLAHRAGWKPIAAIDELGIVLVVFDTPHGLTDDTDFDAARSVLTRLNATALVVLAGAISDVAEVFDSSSLNHGIDAPSGRHSAPRPLISGLAPFDAVTKYLDQTTGVRMAAAPSRGPVSRVDVGDILRESAAAALADAVRQGARFKIAPKRRGYESLAEVREGFEAAMQGTFASESVVQDLLDLVRRQDG